MFKDEAFQVMMCVLWFVVCISWFWCMGMLNSGGGESICVMVCYILVFL